MAVFGRSLLYSQSHCVAKSCLIQRVKAVQIQPFVSCRSIEPLNVGVLSGLTRLDIEQSDPTLIGPFNQGCRDVFWPIVTTKRCRLAAPFDDLL